MLLGGEAQALDPIYVTLGCLAKSAGDRSAADKVDQITDMVTEGVYQMLMAEGRNEQWSFEDIFTKKAITDITAPLVAMGNSVDALNMTQLDTLLAAIAKKKTEVEQHYQTQTSTTPPARTTATPPDEMKTESMRLQKEVRAEQGRVLEADRLDDQMIPTVNINDAPVRKTKSGSTLYGTLGTSYPTKKDMVYFVLTTIRTTPVEMVSRFWGDKSVEKPFIDTASSLYRDGQAPYELIDKGHVVVSRTKHAYEDVITDGKLARAVQANKSTKGQKVTVFIWEVPQADVDAPTKTALGWVAAPPHPWEYAFREEAGSVATKGQLTYAWQDETFHHYHTPTGSPAIVYLTDAALYHIAFKMEA
jgi:hypothetical protein